MSGAKGAKQPNEDAISINSTETDEYSSGAEFLVDRILAERPAARGKEYLILWEGYPEEKSTWEPIGNIQHDEILEAWKERQKLEVEGSKPVFNIAAYNAKLKELLKAKKKRQQLRKQERIRRGIQVPPETDSHYAGDSDLTEFEEVAEKPELKRQPKKPNKAPAQQHPRSKATAKPDSKHSSSDSELDNDLFVGNPKKAKHKALQAIKAKRMSRSSSSALSEDDRLAAKLPGFSQVNQHFSVNVFSILTLL